MPILSPHTARVAAPRATISDVATRAGVSISTVSRVINGTAPVAEDTVSRVRQAIRELNFTPHTAARTLAGMKADTVGILLPELSSAFFAPLILGIESVAWAHNHDLLIYASQFAARAGRPYPLSENNTAGLLSFTNYMDDDEMRRLHRMGFPLVLLFRTAPPDVPIPCVRVDNEQGMEQLLHHLIVGHGCRRIAFLTGGEENEDSRRRLVAYRRILERHGLPFDPALVAEGNYQTDRAQEAVACWLTDGVLIDAVFAGDDQAATGVMAALQRAGVRVPEEIAVVGFDDVPFARLLNPPLTTVRSPIEEAGRAAARLLFRMIAEEPVEKDTVLPTELVVRRSCGCNILH